MSESSRIHVNQIGYLPGQRKVAAVVGPVNTRTFCVTESETGRVVFQGELTGPIADATSGDEVWHADLTALSQPGAYRLTVDGVGTSPVIRVGADVLTDITKAVFKAFYFQRCGMALDSSHAGPWHHAACHTADARLPNPDGGWLDARRPHRGGWHDAGDYGKYTAPGAKAVADLLLAYAFAPALGQVSWNIPESGQGLPDVLAECRYELLWLLQMQDPATGGVHHKVTTKRFPGLTVMPEDDTDEWYFSPISATATASFAAVLALASRFYRPYDPAFSRRCLQAAEHAWAWLAAHPEVPGFRNPPDVFTGEYGDPNDADERFWAAVELYRTTGRAEYQDAAIALCNGRVFNPYGLGWADVGGYGAIACLFAAGLEDDEAGGTRLTPAPAHEWPFADELRAGFLALADHLAGRTTESGYLHSLREEDFIWGSNMEAANRAMHLFLAHRLTGDERYAQAARHHLDYLLGLNPLGQCYVTGFGSRPVQHPHHRPSVADGVEAPVPGLLAGGPNRGLQDEAARQHLAGRPPAKCYLDHAGSYATNEIAIYWNSPLAFALAAAWFTPAG
ncbi:endoglucanase [Alicyclobacillus cellulosilyticus]|uniref:Endoglucanase n=1 Tax=Alicyclobacillus cellulosilyticus TaxID=1003997 RepID=A0A917K465_9BACL|nr:glycoside hydrolase family 9 protein [Alicyclobacillus cellulosilyticus]GGJ00382.1 endoglucanase [Alicyclobacillus cellulosilyticus]